MHEGITPHLHLSQTETQMNAALQRIGCKVGEGSTDKPAKLAKVQYTTIPKFSSET
jgi:hypothetical protein